MHTQGVGLTHKGYMKRINELFEDQTDKQLNHLRDALLWLLREVNKEIRRRQAQRESTEVE
jgi:hypothetical protein